MHVLTVLMQIPLIFHFSRPRPSFKLLYASARFPCMANSYFSDCTSCTENMNVAWPFLVKELVRLPLFHPALAFMLLCEVTNAAAFFRVSHGLLGHRISFTLGLSGYLKPPGPCSKGTAHRLSEHVVPEESLLLHLLRTVTVLAVLLCVAARE